MTTTSEAYKHRAHQRHFVLFAWQMGDGSVLRWCPPVHMKPKRSVACILLEALFRQQPESVHVIYVSINHWNTCYLSGGVLSIDWIKGDKGERPKRYPITGCIIAR